MVTFDYLRTLAFSLPEVEEAPHFDKTSFRVKNKIFVTYDRMKNRATVKLTDINQDVFSLGAKDAIYPVDNKWGRQGWTFIALEKVKKALFKDIITTAYCEVAPKKLARQVRPDGDR